ncbi:ABC transporter ATP-binding protein [Lachnospiraceae bacterium MD1]|uniref:ABC transporter ATP-binding protein n=1 Tax=Variimorphobacter saccharofermentans TaxID=2755051 RepID=A0A839JZI6_9FIRM|nr:ABC transporter ATP-binding protein [Variimorphobacter saccharofermentans]MBB2181891.1 ABC transporter ATP-binding protein [Variimorphobacter saccharofermentans]
MVEFRNVSKVYGQGEGKRIVLDNVTINVQTGEYVWITGKSGSGKSTLLNMISGIDKSDSGYLYVNDLNVNGLSEEEMCSWRGANVGIVFQFFQLLPTLTVLENVLLPMNIAKVIPRKERAARAKELLKMVGLEGHENKYPAMLSGGEQQRVAIARALANDADLIIADEPTGNLDSRSSEDILKIFQELNQRGKTILMVTHEREIHEGVTRNIVIQDGRIIADKLIVRCV